MTRTLGLFLILLCVACAQAPKQADAPPESEIPDPTKLIELAERCDDVQVKKLLTQPLDINQVNSQGVTALMVAARKGCVPVMQDLLDAKADLNIADEQGSTALHYAVLGKQSNAVILLLQYKAQVNVKDGFNLTPLMLAVRFADLNTVKALIKGKADLDAADENGWTPLFFAIPRGDPDIFDALTDVAKESALAVKDDEDDSLVSTAVQYKQYALLKKLVDLHAPANIANKRELTPLLTAIQNDDLDAIRILASAVDLNKPLPDGDTPLMAAVTLRKRDVAGLLYSLKANPETKGQSGQSAKDRLSEAGLDLGWFSAPPP